MKRRPTKFLMLALTLTALLPLNAYAYVITDVTGRSVNGHWWDGGAFSVDGSYDTFCIERNEYLWFNRNFPGTINPYAINGGIGGGPNDPLDPQTAWLYTQYLAGAIPHVLANQVALQLAIWTIEQEFAAGHTYATDYSFVGSEILGLTATYLGNAAGHAGFVGNIAVLNLYEGTTPRQSLLTRVPEPTTLLLLGLGLLGIGIISLRRKRV